MIQVIKYENEPKYEAKYESNKILYGMSNYKVIAIIKLFMDTLDYYKDVFKYQWRIK